MIHMEIKDDYSEKIRYDHPDYPIYTRQASLSAYPNYAAPAHWHNDIELVVVTSGKMEYSVNGEIVCLNKNEGILVNARQTHFGFSSCKGDCEFICVLLHPLLLCVTVNYERDFVLPLLDSKNFAFAKFIIDVAWQKEVLENVMYMYSVKNEKLAPLKIQSAFTKLWILLYENICIEETIKIQNSDLTIIKNMIGFIQQSYMKKISLGDISASGAVGNSKCCKLFAKYTHQTPNTYLAQYRLVKSMQLLNSTDMNVTEIANAVGFSSSSYYAESFRNWSGQTPSEYRKNASCPYVL